jgi:hypothetical protein
MDSIRRLNSTGSSHKPPQGAGSSSRLEVAEKSTRGRNSPIVKNLPVKDAWFQGMSASKAICKYLPLKQSKTLKHNGIAIKVDMPDYEQTWQCICKTKTIKTII